MSVIIMFVRTNHTNNQLFVNFYDVNICQYGGRKPCSNERVNHNILIRRLPSRSARSAVLADKEHANAVGIFPLRLGQRHNIILLVGLESASQSWRRAGAFPSSLLE